MKEARIIGGGSRSALWRQIVCDVMGMEVLKTAEDDASFGAALIAGVGIGAFADESDAVAKCVKVVSSNSPDPRNHERYDRLFGVYRNAQSRLAEINHELHRICEA